MTPAELTSAIARGRYRQGDEYRLHEDLAAKLTSLGIEFEREVRLGSANRIDFLCAGGIGIECKARADKRATFRQLARYAELEQITALILVTATAMGVPAEIGGKPVFYVPLGRSSL